MLQIISGKFFTEQDKYEHDGKGMLFSNCTWIDSIETDIGILEPINYFGDITGFIFNYKNQIEKKDGLLVRCGDDEIVEQFKIICSFGLKSYFSEYREQVVKICSPIVNNKVQGNSAKNFIKNNVELNKKLKINEINHFINLTNKIISLERKNYIKVINALRSVLDSIEAIEYNINLAYSMLIYCLESLSKIKTSTSPKWENLESNIKYELEEVLKEVNTEQKDKIKNILIKDKHFKLEHQFINFIKKNIKDSFYINEADSITIPLRKSQLEKALHNSYQMRSRFVHELEPIEDQIRNSKLETNDVFTFSDNPYLTYTGLFRLTNHVIENYIYSLKSVENESFNYRDELPCIMRIEMAPQYWIWKDISFNANTVNKRLSALIYQLESGSAITDLTKVMEKIKKIFLQTSKEKRAPMLYMFWLYNIVLSKDLKIQDWDKFILKHESYFSELRIENIAVRVIGGLTLPWDIYSCIHTYKKYAKSKHRENNLALSPLSESAILCTIANKAWKSGFGNEYTWLLNHAITELSGKKDIQSYIYSCLIEYKEIDLDKLLNWFKTINKTQEPI